MYIWCLSFLVCASVVDEWRCDPIVSPASVTPREQGYASAVSRYAADIQHFVTTRHLSNWLQQNAGFFVADTKHVLKHDDDCLSASITARVINEIMRMFDTTTIDWNALLPVFDVLLDVDHKDPANSESSINRLLGGPFPVFSLLSSLYKVVPKDLENASLGRCLEYRNRQGKPDKFHWPVFKSLLISGVKAVLDYGIPPLEGGISLTAAVRDRWFALYASPQLQTAAKIADEVFYEYRTEHYEAGCNAGVAAAYLVRSLWFARWDRQAWLQRFISATYTVQQIYVDPQRLSKTDWPIWTLWHIFQLMRRDHMELPVAQSNRVDTEVLDSFLHDGVLAVADCYGWMEPYGSLVLKHITSHGMKFLLLGSCDVCVPYDGAQQGALDVKYEVLHYYALKNQAVLWMDLDIGWLQSPTLLIAKHPNVLTFASKDMFSHGVSPALIYVPKDSPPEVAETFRQVLENLYDNPYTYDLPMWDKLLLHEGAEDVGTWDYQGRNDATGAPDERRLSYWKGPYRELEYDIFDPAVFASGDGWVYNGQDVSTIVGFHFLYADPYTSEQLFQMFFSDRAAFMEAVWQHRRAPKYFEKPHPEEPPFFVQISYAHGCCEKAMKKNMESGAPYFNKQIAFGLDDIDEEFRKHNDWIFAQKKGGGLWIWKPYVIYKTLLQVPDNTIVVYLDAGNHFIADPRPLLWHALNESDVTAPRLGCCFESDWTKREAMVLLGSDTLVVSEKLQIAGYFMAMRKTPLVMEFLRTWLGVVEDSRVLSPDVVSDIDNYPGFIRHMIDQSAFSCLFKKVGFRHISLNDAHKVIKLARWRQ